MADQALADTVLVAPFRGLVVKRMAEQGQLVPGMREHGVYCGNKIYLFASEAALEKFSRNPTGYINQAIEGPRAGLNTGAQAR